MGATQQQQQHDKRLFTALLYDDVPGFSSLLHADNRPKDSVWSDYELLCQAIKFGRRRVAYYLLDKGCCVSKPFSAQLPLHLAIESLSKGCGWRNVVLKLLNAGARVSDRNANGDNAIHLGYAKGIDGHLLDFLVKTYLEEESGMNAVNKDGLGVLHVACTRPKVEPVRQLLEKKADVNRRVPCRETDKFAGYTPLHIAVESGNHEVAQLLLNRGADIYAQNFNGSTPLHLACYCRDSRMIDLILAHDRLTANVTDNNGLSHFMVACTSSEPAFAREHLRVAACKPWTSADILIDSCTENVAESQFAGYTPLHFAAEFGSSAVVELLQALKARCCLMTGRLLTPLMLAHKHEHEHVVRVFRCYCEKYENATLAKKSIVIEERGEKGDKNAPVHLEDLSVASDKGGTVAESVEDRVDLFSKLPKESTGKRIIKITCRLACCNPSAPGNKKIRNK